MKENLETQRELVKLESLRRINNAGVAYANKHATSVNIGPYFYFTGNDCTNFASQILEASGVSQVKSSSIYSGWWHTYSSSIYDHKHSNSWINANTFARYMGVGYTTKNHYSFSANISTHDFIAYDAGSDGDWNHIGYVVDNDSFAAKYSGYNYYDYKVAQHSKNYVAWTSSSTNNWETLANNGYTYGRVRR